MEFLPGMFLVFLFLCVVGAVLVTFIPDQRAHQLAMERQRGRYGADGKEILPANRVARGVGTVTSDLLCAVSQRVPRLYVR